MKRLYYISRNIERTRDVSDALHEAGIDDWHFHVISRDEAGLRLHAVQGAPIYEQLDLVHSGERVALFGAGAGLLVGGLCALIQPFPWPTETWHVVLLTLLTGCFGAWTGGMLGLSRENYRLEPFHEEIAAGNYLMLVDVAADKESTVRELMARRFNDVQRGGEGSSLMNPLETPHRVLQQTTH